MSQRTEQFSCECGKQFNNRNELDKHRQNCATAQASVGRTPAGTLPERGMGGGGSGSNA